MPAACPEYELLIEALVDGEVDADQPDLVRHMAECRGCAAHHAALLALSDRLQSLGLECCTPDLAGTVLHLLHRRLRTRFALVATGLLALKLLDLLGWFGGGFTPRLIVTAGAVLAFTFLRFNPLRLVCLSHASDSCPSAKGEPHASC